MRVQFILGVDVIDYRHYPSKEFQLEWLRCYLEVYHGSDKLVTEHDVHVLYVQTNKFALASHFLWTVWALIQAEHSTIDFDFVTYVLRITSHNESSLHFEKDEFQRIYQKDTFEAQNNFWNAVKAIIQ